MSNQCSVCDTVISKKAPGIQCGGFCGLFFHANSVCSDINKHQLSLVNLPGGRWHCGSCRTDRISPPPTRAPRPSQPRRGTPSAGGDDEDDLRSEISLLRGEIAELRKCVTFCSEKVSDFETQLIHFKNLCKTTEDLKKENGLLKEEVKSLSAKVNNAEQLSRANNVEIQGVTEWKGENLINVVETIGKHVGYAVNKSDIDFATRVPTMNSEKPKHIIVRFLSRMKRDEFVAKSKFKRKESSDPGMKIESLSNNKIYLNEHLTAINKKLFKDARETAKERGYKFTWVQNGSILMRKDVSSRIIHISKPSDLKNIK
ncbi:uncharacterized protein LOC123321026 [Coccinella septempunctata]|uniref:uncharacterized protein LOC123321026 n=1 Tax=Coccinella septempunctata TaxID=41139 RepID=UPI001D069913|nr:uncharacterized protein LOC123321026 [Coccinella septempunctata]